MEVMKLRIKYRRQSGKERLLAIVMEILRVFYLNFNLKFQLTHC